jgi:hypothetical protein
VGLTRTPKPRSSPSQMRRANRSASIPSTRRLVIFPIFPPSLAAKCYQTTLIRDDTA